jgi:glyoxylase-like metal-dependent hydrolase (beta-lactamase superfamily II)
METTQDYTTLLDHKPIVQVFFDPITHTITYVVTDPTTKKSAVIDSVMDYEPHGATISFERAQEVIDYITKNEYTVEWILETHVHADHLSAAPYLKEKLGGNMAIGEHITTIQEVFGKIFNEGTEFERNGSQFDHLWSDNDTFMLGNIPAVVLHTPGHTPADMTYIIGDAVFAGDTLFMPDFGTARVDFPGGSAKDMYQSAQKLFTLPEEMRMFICHDYLPEGREEFQWETTIGEQKHNNVQLNETTDVEKFTRMREDVDSTLGMPRLIIPSIQVNMRAGELPKDKEDGKVYLKVPVNNAFSKNE